MATSAPIPQSLLSYPGTTITLPAGTQVLTPTARPGRSLDRQPLIQAIQERVLAACCVDSGSHPDQPCRMVLLLPDKTRRQNAARLAIDALLELCERNRSLSLTLLFGLGTHPLMAAADITRILGADREQRLARLAVPLLQQTTLQSLNCRPLVVSDPRSGSGETLTLQVPELLWNCDLLLSAGDTDLHPYEGRAGSGGIHKMLAIGVGCMGTVRITHSLEVLTDPLTRPGADGNRFVQLIDHFAQAIISALRSPSGRLRCEPIGISVVSRQPDEVEAFWLGEKEEERACLMKPLIEERSLMLRGSINLVIADTERDKGTDLLAGARNLHLLCNANTSANPILCPSSPYRTALLFNACHERRNAHGIGNSGTVLHLQALLQFSLEAWRQQPNPGQSNGTIEAEALDGTQNGGAPLKAAILDRWERYLHLVSEEERVFGALEESLDTVVRQGRADGRALANPLELLDQALPHSFGAHRHLFSGTRARLLGLGAEAALDFLRQSSDQLGFKGLGEGGQRALRLLTLLRHFDCVHVATDNAVVLDFLNQFNPEATAQDHAGTCRTDSGSGDSSRGGRQPIGLIGLHGISLNEHTAQEALELALSHHNGRRQPDGLTTESGDWLEPRLAFVQQPVILKVVADGTTIAGPGSETFP